MGARQELAADKAGLSGVMLNESTSGHARHCTTREFEVTVLTTRSGTTVVVVAASDREAAHNTIREEIANGDFTVPPEQCVDDVQTEIWTIRERQ